MDRLTDRLAEFAKRNRFTTKGPLCVALVVTRRAVEFGFPLVPDELLTESGGQVAGLGKAAVQAILEDHGITRVLAEEGGRTSRGSVGNMRAYAELLNLLNIEGLADLENIEGWWVDRVRAYFAAKPFILRLDPSKSLQAIIEDVLDQAEKRQAENPGSTFAGTVLQHLVGAKLDLAHGGGIEHRGASVADEAGGLVADFLVGDVAIHVTSAPGEAVVRKCSRNLESGLRPVIVTTRAGAPLATGLAEQLGIGDRVDVFQVEQLIAGNLYELGEFAQTGRRTSAEQLVARYNEIVDSCETDPSLRITVGR